MADLSLNFGELRDEVQRFLGTYNSGSPVAVDVTDSSFIVNRAYSRYVSYYDWTFLSQERTLETNTNDYKYLLPTEFSYLITPFLQFNNNDGYMDVMQRSTAQIKQMRSDNVYNNFPIYFALQASSYYKDTGQGWEMWLYPNPNTKYTLHYTCKINPQKLVDTGDIPIGGADMSDCLLELCLAYAEAYKDERQAVHSSIVGSILGPAKMMDSRRRPSHLGSLSMADPTQLIDFEHTHRGNVLVST